MQRKISWPLTLCAIGATVTLIGELWGASDKKRGGTISERYQQAPHWLKHFASFILGCICSHLWEWNISPKVTIERAETVNVETEE